MNEVYCPQHPETPRECVLRAYWLAYRIYRLCQQGKGVSPDMLARLYRVELAGIRQRLLAGEPLEEEAA